MLFQRGVCKKLVCPDISNLGGGFPFFNVSGSKTNEEITSIQMSRFHIMSVTSCWLYHSRGYINNGVHSLWEALVDF